MLTIFFGGPVINFRDFSNKNNNYNQSGNIRHNRDNRKVITQQKSKKEKRKKRIVHGRRQFLLPDQFQTFRFEIYELKTINFSSYHKLDLLSHFLSKNFEGKTFCTVRPVGKKDASVV